MTKVKVFAPAKVNLTLHITGQRDDGYHLLDSLVCFAQDVGDWVTVEPAQNLTLSVTGPFTQGVPTDESNLVLKAARLLQDVRGVDKGAHIHLEKNLPNGAGIGGGSADAAAILKALADLWGCAPASLDEAVALGADVPVCLAGPAPHIMQGIGEQLSPVPSLPECYLVLVNPGVHIPTGDVFQLLHRDYGVGSMVNARLPAAWDFDDFHIWLLGQHNELTKCAAEFTDTIGQILPMLREQGAADADMSGSGSTCWGLFETRRGAEKVARAMQTAFPGYWITATKVVSS